jgi:tetraacyldisaccharide 4'-kinase
MVNFREISRPYLLPLSLLYLVIIQIRNRLFDLHILRSKKFKIPVISLGNITVGGTGKTPHAEYLVQLLKNDFTISVLSRGYKRKTKDFVFVSSNSSVADVGDEPLQIKLKFPEIHVAVERDRVHGLETLIKNIPKLDVVILDDAFQHRYIKPGLSLLLIDFNRPIFNDMILPAGNLREPWKNATRADAFIITKCPVYLPDYERTLFISKLRPGPKQYVFFTCYTYGDPVSVFPDKHNQQKTLSYKHLRKSATGVLVVTGVANTIELEKFLHRKLHIDNKLTFPDHHNYDKKDLLQIRNRFRKLDSDKKIIIVTEKDAVRIRELEITEKDFRQSFYYVPIEVKFLSKGEKPFVKKIYRFIRNKSRK